MTAPRRKRKRAERFAAAITTASNQAKLRGAILAALIEDMSGRQVVPPNCTASLKSYELTCEYTGVVTMNVSLLILGVRP